MRIIGLVMVILWSGALFASAAEQIYERNAKSVYTVFGYHSPNKSRNALGSAVAVTPKLLATNCHAAKDATHFQVKLKKRYRLARLVYANPAHDLCLLSVPAIRFTPVDIRLSSEVKIGEEVYTIGNPHGLEKSISRGIISNKHRSGSAWMLQTDASISVGSSGGGLFDSEGRLIGITRAGHMHKDIAFALPTEWILQGIRQVKKNKSPEKIVFKVKDIIDNKAEKNKKIKVNYLGTFGESGIRLVKHDAECWLAIKGYNSEYHLQGLLFWYPHRPLILRLFPNTKSIDTALKFQQEYTDTFQHPDSHWEIPKQLLPSAANQTPLIGMKWLTSPPMVVKVLQRSPLKHFLNEKTLQLSHASFTDEQIYKRLTFSLDGFRLAMKKYYDVCE